MSKLAAVFGILLAGLLVRADIPGAHPAFLHALSDLREARSLLAGRGGSDKMKKEDAAAIIEIDHCIAAIKAAAIDDGKSLNDHPKADADKSSGPVHHARELLEQSKKDIVEKETDPKAKQLRDRSIHFLEAAMKHIDASIAIGK